MRTFGTYYLPNYDFHIRHNLELNEWNAIRHRWELTSPTHSQVSLIHLINHYSDKGWSACDPLDLYRSIPAYSNSRLGSIRNQLLNRTELPSRSVFVFGTAFHEIVLQPQVVADARDYFLSVSKLETLYAMRKAVTGIDRAIEEMRNGQIETVFQWTDASTGLPCKAKVDSVNTDLVYGDRVVYDLKTTSATDESAFAASITDYDYLRQAAFYLDATGADRFLFVGVSKRKPHAYFIVEYFWDDPRIIAARKRYQFILRKAKKLGMHP